MRAKEFLQFQSYRDMVHFKTYNFTNKVLAKLLFTKACRYSSQRILFAKHLTAFLAQPFPIAGKDTKHCEAESHIGMFS